LCRVPPVFVLALALLGISFSGPLVRLSGAHPIVIAFWRLAISLVMIAVMLAVTGTWRQWRTLSRRDVLVASGAGVMLAFHFWSWNASVGLTTIAAAATLVNMMPAIVAVASARWLGESPSRRQWIGIGVAMLGAAVIAVPDFVGAASGGAGAARNAMLGDLLAIVGAVTAALYYVAGRRLRATLDLWPYVGIVYGACFVVLALLALGLQLPVWPQPPRQLAIFLGLAVGPMMLGHTGMNYALRYLPAYVVNLTVLGEPVGATLLAMLIPGIGEVPGLWTVVGGSVLLGGVLLAGRR
jgi:drug/metabolite transporter (DMT)-like permease